MGRFNGLGFRSKVNVGNTAGVILGQVGVTGASAAGNPAIEGLLHSIFVGADASAQVVTVYDNLSAAGTILFQATIPIGGTLQAQALDLQALVGLFLVVSGGTTTGVTTVAYD